MQRRTLAIESAAATHGFLPTAAELDAYVAEFRARTKVDPRGAAQVAAYFSGLGVTEDQYYADPEVRDNLAHQLAAERLQQSVVGGLTEGRQAAWDAFVESILASTKVVVYDVELK